MTISCRCFLHFTSLSKAHNRDCIFRPIHVIWSSLFWRMIAGLKCCLRRGVYWLKLWTVSLLYVLLTKGTISLGICFKYVYRLMAKNSNSSHNIIQFSHLFVSSLMIHTYSPHSNVLDMLSVHILLLRYGAFLDCLETLIWNQSITLSLGLINGEQVSYATHNHQIVNDVWLHANYALHFHH